MKLEQFERTQPVAPSSDGGAIDRPKPRPLPAEGRPTAIAPGQVPTGTVPIRLSLDRIQAMGVRTALATEKETNGSVRVTSVVAAPEDGMAEVHTRSSGFVEGIAVAETGVTVREGQLLLNIYSPELYQAETELLTVRKWPLGDGGARGDASARMKLHLLGMSDGDIVRMIAKGEPLRAVPIYAPHGGVISKKSVVLGSYVTPESALYEIQDLSHVYVVADVLQRDAGRLHVGLEGRFVPGRPSAPAVTAKLDLIYPTVSAEARTTRVRMRVANDGRRFAPGEYGTVEFALPTRKVLVVPRDAVIDTGLATYVFVVESEGRFSPRAVVTTELTGEDLVVEGGLVAGDRVVSGATFLIDSESRLEAAETTR